MDGNFPLKKRKIKLLDLLGQIYFVIIDLLKVLLIVVEVYYCCYYLLLYFD